MASKYTERDFYNVIYHFYTLEKPSESNLAEKTGCKKSYVNSTTTKLLDLRLNLGELARNSTNADSFIRKCIKNDYIKNKP